MMPSASLTLAASTTTTTVPPTSTGYLYDLFRHWGLGDLGARTAQFLLFRPLEVVVIALVAWAAGRLGSRVARWVLSPFARRASTAGTSGRGSQRITTVGQTVSSLWKAVVWVVAAFMIISALGIDLTPLVAGATVVGAALAFGAQRIVLDLLSGFFLLVEDQFGVGDSLTIGDTTGVVEEFHLRVTRLRGEDGTTWYVPNGEIRVLGNRYSTSERGAGAPPEPEA